MKGILLFCACMCFGPVVKSQGYSDFASIDHKALQIPTPQTYSSDSIAGFVQSNFKTAPEKLRAIYTWVINNIRYDTDSMYLINWQMYNDEKISATLRRKKGVCENYASLFTDIALKSGFQSFVISGYTKMGGSVNRMGHSWSAVYLEQQWYLCDPTWDIGSRGNTNYFLISPGQFIESHFPFDPLWQLLEKPLTEHEFDRGYSRSKKETPAFHFADSAKLFLQMDSLQQLEAATRRIKQAGIENERQQTWLAYNQMKIAIISGEKDSELYNSAVGDLNKAKAVFNDFVQYRNNRFVPAKPDAGIRAMLNPIPALLSLALKKLEQMGKPVENFQYDTGSIKERINILSGRVQEQQDFLKRYLSSSEPERGQLFYK